MSFKITYWLSQKKCLCIQLLGVKEAEKRSNVDLDAYNNSSAKPVGGLNLSRTC